MKPYGWYQHKPNSGWTDKQPKKEVVKRMKRKARRAAKKNIQEEAEYAEQQSVGS